MLQRCRDSPILCTGLLHTVLECARHLRLHWLHDLPGLPYNRFSYYLISQDTLLLNWSDFNISITLQFLNVQWLSFANGVQLSLSLGTVHQDFAMCCFPYDCWQIGKLPWHSIETVKWQIELCCICPFTNSLTPAANRSDLRLDKDNPLKVFSKTGKKSAKVGKCVVTAEASDYLQWV